MGNNYFSIFLNKQLTSVTRPGTTWGMQPMQKNKNVSFALPSGLFTQLKETAKQDGRSISGQIRFLLASSVTRRGTKAEAAK
jgi:hypothetical protein